MKQWVVKIGKREISVNDHEGTADAIEICTRALEHLAENNIDYAVGPLIEVRCGNDITHQKSTVVLANAGRYFESAELARQIKNHTGGSETNLL